jgi:hypothetical protein
MTTTGDPATTATPRTSRIRQKAGHEPVALAGVIRTLLYGLLGTRLDARTLAEVVFVAETIAGMVLRNLVVPTAKQTKRPARPKPPAADVPALHAA